jgi:quinol monooxygenase YgiN
MGVTAVVQHHVADYEVWRKAYDGFGDVQRAGGVTRQSVYRSIEDPNNVLITHGFASAADAEKFLAGTELRAAMQQAGVQGQPRVEIYQDA